MSTPVQYEVSLKDLITDPLKKIEGQAGKTETAVHGISGAGEHMGNVFTKFSAIAVGALASIGIGEFLHSSVEAFNESEQSAAQLTASLKSTGAEAWITKEALDAQALALMNMSLYDDDAITKSQSLLLTFREVRGEIFNQAIPAITDLATKMGGDLQGATLQVGKALNDPIKGITALRRAGVSFNEGQIDTIKHLVNTNQLAKAQTMILGELTTEFGGSAKAASEAGTGPFTVLAHQFGNVKEEIGGIVLGFTKLLIPVLTKVVGLIHDSITWMREHKDLLYAIGVAAGVAAVGFGIYYIWTNAITIATEVWTGVQWLLNAALTANPIGIVIVAIGVMVGAVIYAWNKFAGFRAFLYAMWGTIKEFGRIVGDIFQGLWHTIHGVFTFNPSEMVSGFTQMTNTMSQAGTRMGKAYKEGWDEGMADFAKDHEKNPSLVEGPAKEKKAPALPSTTKEKGPKASTTGTKNIKIDIKINNLIDKFSVNTTNIQEGYAKIKEHVAMALTGAVNDSQIVAGE